MKRTITLVLVTMLVKYGSYAQAPVIQWQQSYGGTLIDDGRSVDFASDGGYIFTGTTYSSDNDVALNHGGADFWVVKTNSFGTIQWQTSLGGTSDDSAYTVKQTLDGGYIVSGWTKSNDGNVSGNHGNKDWWIVKINSDGNTILWQKTYGGSDDEEARNISQTSEGGYIATGFTRSNDDDVSGNQGGSDVWVLKLDASGTIEWQRTLGGTANEIGNRILQTPDGGYVFSATTSSNNGDVSGNHGLDDIWIVKLDSSGTVIEWSNTYGGSGNDRAGSIRLTSDTGYVFVATTRSFNGDVTGNHGMQDAWVVNLDSLGFMKWQQTLGGTEKDRGVSIVQTTDGSYVVLVNTQSNDGDVTGNHGGWDTWVAGLNSSGTVIDWQQTFGGTDNDFGRSILLLPSGGYAVLGSSASNDGDITGNHGAQDYWFSKLLFHCPSGTVTANISGDTAVCLGGQAALILTFTGTAPWKFSINGSSPQITYNNPDTVYVGPASANTYYLSYAFDDACADSGIVSGSATVTIGGIPPADTVIISTSILKGCTGTIGSVSTNTISGLNIQYRWSGPAGTLFSDNAAGPFSAGPFVTPLPQAYFQLGPLAGSSGYDICATAFNDCGEANSECQWIRGTVSTPGAISGETIACSNDSKQYSVAIGAADTLLWTFSVPGATITPTSPTGSDITIDFPVFTTGNLCVKAALYCLGSSISGERCLTIRNTPALPAAIIGSTFSVCGGTTLDYSIVLVPGAIDYTWSAAGGILFDGSPSPYTTTNDSVAVTFPVGYSVAHNLCVAANSACASSATRCRAVYSLIPGSPGIITADPSLFCNGGSVSFFVAPVSGATSYNWIVPNGAINFGQGTDSINVTWGIGAGLVRVSASNSCGQGSLRTQSFTPGCRESETVSLSEEFIVYPNPAHNKITVSFTNSGNNYYSMVLSDVTGRIVFNENKTAGDGSNTTEINLAGYEKGVYFLELRSDERTFLRKIFVE